MALGTLAILSLMPIAVVGVVSRRRALAGQPAMPISYAVAVFLALFVWRVPAMQVAVATITWPRSTVSSSLGHSSTSSSARFCC